jgi:hypothetical protein
MRYVIFLAFILSACAKPSNNCTNPTGTALYNQQTINLINGGCNVTTTPATVNKLSVQQASICGLSQGYLYQSVLYNPSVSDPTSPLGIIQYPDNYMVFPQGTSTQCWFKITQGQIDAGAANPTF